MFKEKNIINQLKNKEKKKIENFLKVIYKFINLKYNKNNYIKRIYISLIYKIFSNFYQINIFKIIIG